VLGNVAAMQARLKDFLMLRINDLHRTVFRLSKGRIANRGAGMPVVMLTTTGRKSGKRRTSMLTSPVQDGDRIVLVASQGGLPRNPQWFANLRAHPDTQVQVGAELRLVRARVAGPEERARLWPRLVELYADFASYAAWTDRVIPVVVLEPR
jgi:deazaflavin-dependent oxidoreductase (nitroreductase family)